MRKPCRSARPSNGRSSTPTGSLLFDRGAVIIGADEHRFLFTQFKPQRGDVTEPGSASHAAAAASDDEDTLSVNDMHLSIGALIGMRPQGISGASMHPGRIIGYAPNQSLFVTPALVDGRPLPLSVGENVEIVAIASQAVFRFVCTVDAVCPLPFGYAVLSKPGMIRRLRERKSIRVRTRLPVRFGLNVAGDAYEGLGVAQDDQRAWRVVRNAVGGREGRASFAAVVPSAV